MICWFVLGRDGVVVGFVDNCMDFTSFLAAILINDWFLLVNSVEVVGWLLIGWFIRSRFCCTCLVVTNVDCCCCWFIVLVGLGVGGVVGVVTNVTGLFKIDCILLADFGCTAIGVILTSSFWFFVLAIEFDSFNKTQLFDS